MLRFHTIGNWSREQVRVTWTHDTRPRIAEVEKAIEQSWDRAQARPAMQLFDGAMCRLEAWDADPQALSLALSRTSYKPFFGTNLHNPHLAERFGKHVLANPVGVSPALISGDDFLLMGRRNTSVAYYPNRLHPFAGSLEPRDDLHVFDDVARELHEELSLETSDIADIRCTGLVEDTVLRQPEIIFVVRANRTRAEIESQVDRREHGGSWSIPATRDAVEVALADIGEFTPVAIATLLLWGQLQFNGDWFGAIKARFCYDDDTKHRGG